MTDKREHGESGRLRVAQVLGFVIAAFIASAVVKAIRTPQQISPDYLEEMGVESSTARVLSAELTAWLDRYEGDVCQNLFGEQCDDLVVDAEDSAEAFKIGLVLGQQQTYRGVARLGGPEIAELVALNLRFRQDMPSTECARFSRGEADRSAFARAISRFDSANVVRFVRLQRRAYEAQALDDPPAPTFTAADEDDAWGAWLGLLSDSELGQANMFFEQDTASDDLTCGFERMFWRNLPRLDERHAKIILWTLAGAK